MLKILEKFFLVLLISVAISACAKTYGRQNVWQHYDYLTPVPQDSGLNVTPSSRIVPYNPQTYDNDNNYVIPYQFGVVGERDSVFGWNNHLGN